MTKQPMTVREETPMQEIERMRLIRNHHRKLSLPSREFVLWLMQKYQYDDLPIHETTHDSR